MPKTRTSWTYEQMDMLHSVYPHVQTRDFAKQVNKTEAAVTMRANKFKVKKSSDYKIIHSEEVVEAKRQRQLGKKIGAFSLEHRKKISDAQPTKGKGSGRDRRCFEYKEWRRLVFERDDYSCQICLARGGAIQADHIKPYALFEELRHDVNNGRTLCVDCHRKTNTYGVRFDLLLLETPMEDLRDTYGVTF